MYGAYGSLNPLNSKSHIQDLNIEWYPIDADVISLENKHCLSELINGNISSLMDIARALTSLQAVFGRFPIVRSKGDFSCAIVDIMRRLMIEDSDLFDNSSKSDSNVISQCIIIDRTIDMITPCLTPRTYEGLLDQVFGIENSIIKVNKNILGRSAQKTKVRGDQLNIVLNSSDLIFEQIRDTAFKYLGKLLSTMAEHIRLGYEARHEAKTSKELNAYIKRFKNLHADHSLVEQHVHLADYISNQTSKKMKYKRKLEHEFSLLCNQPVPNGITGEDYLEELIGKRQPIENVLKFMILISLTQGGISSKKYDVIKKNIIQTYGINYLLTLDLLEKYILISRYETLKRLYSSQSEYFNWSNVKKSFNLVKKKEELDFILSKQENKSPTQQQIAEMVSNPAVLGQYDINLIGSYSNGGYSPLSARLVEASTRPNGWKAIQSELRELKGKCYINQSMNKDVINNKKSKDDEKGNNNNNNNNLNNLLNINNGNNNNNNSNNKQQRQETRKQKAQQKSDAMSTHKTVLVFFVGGVTYAEISAIRMLEARPNTPWKFIVASTNIARGNDIINAFIDQSLK